MASLETLCTCDYSMGIKVCDCLCECAGQRHYNKWGRHMEYHVPS